MTAREIRDHSLSLARAGDQVREIFEGRSHDAAEQFSVLVRTTQTKGSPPLLMRVTAAPMSPQGIDRLTRRPELWWCGGPFLMKLDGQDYACQYPARDFNHRPEFRLRSLMYEHPRTEGGVSRLLQSNGVVEFTLRHPWRELGDDGSNRSKAYFGWLYSLVVGAYSQVRNLQQKLAWDAVDFGLQLSIFGASPFGMVIRDEWYQSALEIKEKMPLSLPLYEISPDSSVDDILSELTGDIFNACGSSMTLKCEVPSTAMRNLNA